MQGARHAIVVTPNTQGWTWELINVDGAITATGVTSSQDRAMESAWRAAGSFCGLAPDEFPQIILGQPGSRASAATAQP